MKNILIVEDEKLIAEAIAHKLEGSDFAVKIAEDGQVALDMIAESVPDLILLDIVMPVMGGVSFIKEIKNTKYKDIPIIVLTNLNDDEQVAGALQHGVTDYLVKVDYSLNEVVEVIKKKLQI